MSRKDLLQEISDQLWKAEEAENAQHQLSVLMGKIARIKKQIEPYKDTTYTLDHTSGRHGYCIPVAVIEGLFIL